MLESIDTGLWIPRKRRIRRAAPLCPGPGVGVGFAPDILPAGGGPPFNPTTQAGGNASSWLDQSGSSHHFTQGTVGSQPAVENAGAGGINNRQDLKYNGTTSAMTGPGTSTLLTTTAFTILFVAQPVTLGGTYVSPAAYGVGAILSDSGSILQIGFSANGGGQAFVVAFDGAYHEANVSGIVAGSNYLITVRLSGGTLSIQSAQHAASTVALGTMSALATSQIGENYNATAFSSARIGEVMAWNNDIGNANVATAQAAMIAKWGIAT